MSINHIAIVPDGNGRWATANNLHKNEGHKQGAENIIKIIKEASALGVKHLTIWGFSSENWRRTDAEIDDLMHLFSFYLSNDSEELHKNNIKFKIIGDITKLSFELQQSISNVESRTQANTGLKLYVAISYGGKDEIIRACKKIISDQKTSEEINEKLIESYMDAPEMPPVDLLIRTSGEMRISNFLIWQIAYSELYFTNVLWPDFGKEELQKAIEDFHNRKRNFGYAREQIR